MVKLCEEESNFRFAYEDDFTIEEKIEAIATKIYRADGINILPAAKKQIDKLEELGFGKMPVCMAKTQYSFSDDAAPVSYTHLCIRCVKEIDTACYGCIY